MISLAENCKNLQYLCVSNCNRFTDASVISLAKHCPKLETLEVGGCSLFTDAGFLELAKVRILRAARAHYKIEERDYVFRVVISWKKWISKNAF